MNKQKYAARTTISPEKSKAEIEKLLKRYGARQFGSFWDDNAQVAIIAFSIAGSGDGQPRQVRMHLPYPNRDEHKSDKHYEQAERSAWRALVLVVKAKLEAVDSGISTIEREFFADIVMPDGRTLSTALAPQIDEAYATGKMPRLLLEAGS